LREQLKQADLYRRQLEIEIARLRGKRFQPSSEKISIEQLELELEGLSLVENDKDKPTLTESPKKKRSRNKKTQIPDDLPVEIRIITVPEEDRICPDTGREREFVRYEESEKIEWVPGYFKRVIIKREVLATKCDESDPLPDTPMITAEMPAEYSVIPGCMAGIRLIVHLLVSRYCDHLPFYRLEQIFRKRHNVKIDRGLMCHWLKRISESLQILYEALLKELIESGYLQIDETFIKLLDPERKGKARQSYFWVIRHPKIGVLFRFDRGRSADVPLALLKGFAGRLQSDGYSVYETLQKRWAENVHLVMFNCWAHARRKIKESLEANGAVAAWYLAKIRELYAIEDEARTANASAEEREALREDRARPVLKEIREMIDKDLDPMKVLPSSPLGKAIRYIDNRWENLERYAQDGYGGIEIDNNFVENSIRPTAVGKKNWLFIGHPNAGQVSAVIYTIIENCRMNEVNPFEYLVNVLPRIQDHPINRISELLPRQWAEAKKESAEPMKQAA
jgi:transposase